MRRVATRTKRRVRIPPAQWRRAVTGLGFSDQQASLVRLMLEGKKDKQIATALKIGMPTVRAYMTRLFDRTGAHDRVDLLLHVFAFLMADCVRNHRHQK